MKPSTRLDSVVFQLTPTRTRCDLLITANGKTEKIATGLLDPFLAHLKTAQEQVAKGGYSFVLKPKDSDNAAWFTKGTIERFVRFVSNPDVLERVYTLETEIMQIREAIGIQNNCEVALTVVADNLRAKRAESTQGGQSLLQLNEEKAIVLYEPDAQPKQTNLSTTSNENSKVQVLKALKTRKKMLQTEQGMAFARAVAAGFQVDDMLPLISFAKSFGASRLMDACLKIKDLWKKKHESGQWVEIEATQPNISANVRRNSWPGTTVNNDVNSRADSKANVNQEHWKGQHPQPVYAPWPVHSPPGTFPVFQGYTMQGMPYYPNYHYPSPYPSTDDSRRSSGQRKAKKHHSSCSEESGSEDEDKEKGKSSRRRKSSKVVIRNINFINSKKQDRSETESESEEGAMVVECYNGKERETKRTEADTGDWHAFQTLLLQDADREERTVDHMMEKETAGSKRQGRGIYDPLAHDKREEERYQEKDTGDIQNGVVTHKVRGSSDSFIVHQRENCFENPSDSPNLNGFDNSRNAIVNMDDDSCIVTREAGSNTRNAIDIVGSEVSSYHQADGNERNKINYEPHDLSLIPERETENLSAGYDPALDFGSKALKKKNKQEAGVTKKSMRDPTSRLSNDAADKRKASGTIRKGRPTKMTPLDEARARADKLRNFKADLLVMKREKEEEERKRIEALKIARQKRIASKSSSTVGQSQLSAQQTRKHLPNRFSPGAPRTSKFSDTEPGSLAPLQRRLHIRSASLGSNESQKVPKNSKLSSGSKSTANTLTRSISPLPPSKRESIATGNRLTRSTSPLPLSKRETRVSLDCQNKSVSRTRRVSEPKMGTAPSSAVRSLISPLPLSKRETRVGLDSQKKSVSRTRRLSEPKMGNNSAPSTAVRSMRTVASKKVSDAPEIKKISAIVNYDIAKIASLPELKIKPPKGVENIKSSASEIEQSGNKKKPPLCQNAVDETPVIEKTVVMVLPSSARSISADQTKESKAVPGNPTINDCSPSAGADNKVIETTQETGNDLVLVRPETLSDLITETPKFQTIQSVVEKPYEAPHAWISSSEVPGTVYTECSQEPGPSFHSNETAQENVKVLAPEKKISEALEKSQTKESATKGLRKLLRFGKKNPSSSTSEYHTKSDNAAANSNKDHEPAVTSGTTTEAFTLKNLISQDETPTAATASQKSSRHFSLLSPFKNKKRVSQGQCMNQSPFTVFKSCSD